MPGSEVITLDPSAVATNRTALPITDYVALDGVDWGDAAITAYMSESQYGSRVIDYTVPNRTVTMPLRLQARGTETFEQIRRKFQSKVARIQQDGKGWLGRVTSNGGTVYADVVNASLKLTGGYGQARGRYDEGAVLHLECVPDWYGNEVTLSSHSGTTFPELTFTEAGIKGDYPARCRLVVTELQSQAQRGLIWGFRSKNYSSASTAALAYEAEALTGVSGSVTTRTGASGGASNNVFSNTALTTYDGTTWTSILSTNVSGARMTHKGSYRVWARVYVVNNATYYVRFQWAVGSLASSPITSNAPASAQGAIAGFRLLDLGEIRIDEVATGTHGWEGRIQAAATVASSDIEIDRIFFQPLDEAAGRHSGGESSEAALESGKRVEIRTDGSVRETATTDQWGPPHYEIGDVPRVPVAGLEGRTVECFVKASRGDVEADGFAGEADAGVDDIAAQLYYRPCWLYVPE